MRQLPTCAGKEERLCNACTAEDREKYLKNLAGLERDHPSIVISDRKGVVIVWRMSAEGV